MTGKPKRIFILAVFLVFLLLPLLSAQNSLDLGALTEEPEGFILSRVWSWKYSPVHDEKWLKTNVDDSSWENLNVSSDFDRLLEREWNGTGWFRCHFDIDDSLKGRTVLIYIRHLGGSDVFLNEKRIYRFGHSHSPESNGGGQLMSRWAAFTFDFQSQQVLAVRYNNPSWKFQRNLGFDPGFQLRFMDLNKGVNYLSDFQIFITKHKNNLLAIPAVLAFLHLFLFLFYPQSRENLYYFFCLAGFAAFFYFAMQRYLEINPGEAILYYRIGPMLNTVTISFLLLTVYSIVYPKIPRRYLIFISIAVLLGVWGFFRPLGVIHYGLFLLTTVIIFESIRSFVVNRSIRKTHWIILFGLITLALLSIYQIFDVIIPMIADRISEPPRVYYRVYTYGGMVFIICMSIYLAFQYSRTNRDLKNQLAQVRELSEKNLLQERKARKREIERHLLEAENARKSRELEEARELQLSMLPQNIPQQALCDIDVFMKTATEVGGDYYDFHSGKDGSLTVVIGDATGHGMKAGSMVTVTKSLFGTYNESMRIPDFYENCSSVIKNMKLGHLFMAMMILRIRNNKIVASGAGMPPVLLLKDNSSVVEEIQAKGPPLGALSTYSYKQTEIEVGKGDMLLLMSDGFVELFNEDDEMLGLGRVKSIFRDAAGKPFDKVIESLNESGLKWSRNRAQADDITFILIKFK
jgi:serine phosphatase RsbU (regulator of sigma subunit)